MLNGVLYIFQMISLKELLTHASTAQPYSKGIRVTIMKRKDDHRTVLAVADESAAAKCYVSEDSTKEHLQPGKTFILRNYNVGRQVLFINKATRITATANQTIPKDVAEDAMYFIDPQTPPRQLISSVTLEQKPLTIEGKIEQVIIQ